MNHRSLTSALLAVTLTLGCGGVVMAQAPMPVQANIATPFDAAVAAYNRKDYATAVPLFRSLAAQGNAEAQFNLGAMYSEGQGVAQDYKEMVRLYGLAAAQGNLAAQNTLGAMYQVGLFGVSQDYKEAARLYGLAAAQGNAQGQNFLGAMYREGWGVAQDYKEAARLFGLAAAQGNAEAQNNLGAMYDWGHGVAPDYVRAYMWLNLAASSLSGEQGKKASTSRDNVASRMTPSQIELGQDIARKCQAANFKQCDALELERIALLKAQAPQPAAQAVQSDSSLLWGLAGAFLNGVQNGQAAQAARRGVSTSCNTVGTRTSCTSN